MNYQMHYDKLMTKAFERMIPKEIYSERHHVIPTCLGGINNKNNIVRLLPREHFIAHLLLHKIHPDNSKLSYSLWMMCNGNKKDKRNYKISGRIYEEVRKAFVKILKEREPTFKGKKHTNESNIKNRESHIGKPGTWIGKTHTEDSKMKMRDRKVGIPIPENIKKNMSQASMGKSKSEEHKKNISKAKLGEKNPMFGKKAKRVICPHCSKEVAINLANKLHFDNCKNKKI